MDKLVNEIMLRKGIERLEARQVADELIESLFMPALSAYQIEFALLRVRERR